MDSADVRLDDDSPDSTDQVSRSLDAPGAATPRRLPAGTLAPPLADGSALADLRALAEQHRAAQAQGELAQTLRRMIDVGDLEGAIGEDEAIELYAELGQLEADVLGRFDEAIDAWRKVLAIDPSDLRALAALEELFAREARWEDVVDVLEKRALVLDDDDQRRATLLEAATTCEAKLEDLPRAAQLYERVRAAEPASPVASERLEVIYRERGQWTELVELLLERSETLPEIEAQIELLGSVAQIYEDELGDEDSAFYVLQAAFNRDPARAETVQQLERLAGATHRWQELLDEATGRVAELEPTDRGAAAELWVKIGRWYADHLSHRDYAIHSVQQALRIDPAHAGALAAIAELQRAGGDWSDLVATRQRQADLEPDPEQKAELYLQLAELLEDQVQDLAGAIQSYRQALHHGARCEHALERLYRRTAAWQPLIGMLARRAEAAADAEELAHCQLEIGEIWDEQLGDAGQAIAAYQHVLDLDPQHPAALHALEQLYARTGQAQKYLGMLEAQLATAPSDGERVALYERIAAAWEERFAKLDRAADAYEQILAIDARNDHAFRELARLYQQAGAWEPLVDTYRNHAQATGDVATRIELYAAMAQAFETQLADPERAVAAYRDVLALDPDEPRALDAVARLCEQLGDWHRAIDAMTRLVQLVEDPREQAALYTRVGRLQYGQLADAEAGEVSLERALALDPSHMPALEALTNQYCDRGDWQKAALTMVRAERCTRIVTDKVHLLIEAATMYQHRLHDDAQAKQLYAAAIALDPEHVDAGRPLAELYFRDRQWAELRPVIEMLCRKIGQLRASAPEQLELYARAAACAAELGDPQRALHFYKAACELDPNHLPALLGRADLLFDTKDWDGAGKLYQTILAQHRDGHSEAELVRIYHRLGAVRRALGERKRALDLFAKVLELDPRHRETLEAVVELHGALHDWEAVIRAKRGLLATASEAEQVQLLDQIGGIYKDRLANPQKATAAYVEALEVAPDDRQRLQKLLDLYSDTQQWKKAVETIERFAALEADPLREGVYWSAAATVARDELKSLDEAVDYYDRALDCFFADPEQLDEQHLSRALRAFEAIDTLLTAKRDWQGQERAYRAMINRLPQGGGPRFQRLCVSLLDGLGEIYRSRLKQYEDAAGVFEIAQQLDPDDALRAAGAPRGEILAELYGFAGADRADQAIAQHMRMLRREPFKYDSYKALARIYLDTRQYDKAWCVCHALTFLKKASADEHAYYEQHKPRGLTKASRAMSPESWAKLAPADENRYISAIFGACWQGVAALKAFPHKDFGVRREDRRQLATDDLMFSRLLVYAAQALGVQLPDVYLADDDKAAELQLANAIDKSELCPSFVARPHLLQGKNERELAFISAKWLAFMRPEYYLRMLLPTNTERMVVVLSAIAMLQPRFPVPPNMADTVQQYLPKMRKRMPPHVLEQLGVVVERFIQAAPTIDLATWSHAVDAAAHRAGFVVCGDLSTAARMIAAEPTVIGGPKAKDKLKELVLFSISDELFAIRAQMGLAIAG